MGQVINGTLVGVILTKELEKIKDELWKRKQSYKSSYRF
jgi:hypothetical protein